MVNLAVFMGQNIALTDDFTPRDIRGSFPSIGRHVPGRLANYLNYSFCRSEQDAIFQKRCEIMMLHHLNSFIGCLQHIP